MMYSEKCYMKYLKKCKTLSKNERRDLVRLYQNGDKKALELIVNGFQPLVFKISAQQVKYTSLDFMDLVQEANLALIEGIKDFDLSRNSNLTTYLFYIIRYKLMNYIQENQNLIKMSSYLRKKNQSTFSFSIDAYEKELGEVIMNSANHGLDNPECIYYYRERKNVVHHYLNMLEPKTRSIIKYRFGFYDNKKFKLIDIGKKYNVSKSAIHQSIKKGLKQLKKNIQLFPELQIHCIL